MSDDDSIVPRRPKPSKKRPVPDPSSSEDEDDVEDLGDEDEDEDEEEDDATDVSGIVDDSTPVKKPKKRKSTPPRQAKKKSTVTPKKSKKPGKEDKKKPKKAPAAPKKEKTPVPTAISSPVKKLRLEELPECPPQKWKSREKAFQHYCPGHPKDFRLANYLAYGPSTSDKLTDNQKAMQANLAKQTETRSEEDKQTLKDAILKSDAEYKADVAAVKELRDVYNKEWKHEIAEKKKQDAFVKANRLVVKAVAKENNLGRKDTKWVTIATDVWSCVISTTMKRTQEDLTKGWNQVVAAITEESKK